MNSCVDQYTQVDYDTANKQFQDYGDEVNSYGIANMVFLGFSSAVLLHFIIVIFYELDLCEDCCQRRSAPKKSSY
jgi:hypothetical protein